MKAKKNRAAAKTRARPDLFPAGNAAVGDRVYFWRIGQLDQEPCLGRVVKVGLRNEHGQFLSIRVRPSRGRAFVSSTYLGSRLSDRDMVVVLEPTRARFRRECAQVLQWFYRDNGRPRYRVRVARLPSNSSVTRYRLICTECWGEIFRSISVRESAELRIDAARAARFGEGKPAIEDSDSRLVCDCEEGPDASFVKFMETIEIEEYH